MEMYRVAFGEITKCEVTNETAKRITFIRVYEDFKGDIRHLKETENKKSQYSSWHKTFEDAQNHIIDTFSNAISNLEKQIIANKSRIDEAKAIQKF